MSPTAARQSELLDELAADDAAMARIFGAKIHRLAELAVLAAEEEQSGGREQFASMELAGTCRMGRLAAQYELAHADRYVEALPLTVQLLDRGELYLHQARTLLKATENCSVEVARRVEAQVLSGGGHELSPPDLRKQVKRAVHQVESDMESDEVTERLTKARADRRTSIRPEEDGMASIRVVAPAEQVQLWARDTEQLVLQEKAFDRASGVWRSADQIRADLVVTMPGLLLGARADAGIGTRVAPSKETLVNVFVPVVTLLEHGNEPGELEGYGPISAEHVRLLLPHARLRRALVDAETGQPVSLDEDVQPASGDIDIARQRLLAMVRPSVVTHRSEPQHDPSASLRRFVDLRDLRCDGIGCSVPARRSHKDHRIPWPEGPTAAWNLDARSGSCHRAKHSGWRVKVEADGSTAWLSPLGRSYLRPPPYSPPLLPPDGARLRPPRKPATEAAPDDAGDGPMTLPASPVDVVRPEPTDDEDDCPF